MVTHACDPSTQEMEAGISGVRGYPQLHSEFKASLGYLVLKGGLGGEVVRISKKRSKWTSDLILLTRLAKAFSHPTHLVTKNRTVCGGLFHVPALHQILSPRLPFKQKHLP